MSNTFGSQFYRLWASYRYCVNRRVLAKVLSLYGTPEKYIKVIAMYENNTAVVKVGNEVSNWFCTKSGVKQGCILSPFIWIILMDFVLGSTGKGIGDYQIKWRGKTFLDLCWLFKHIRLKFEQNKWILKICKVRVLEQVLKFMLRRLS